MKSDLVPAGAKPIGRGRQGVVYGLSPDRCVKIYRRSKHAVREHRAYRRAQSSPHLPQIYEAGPGYLVMEYVEGQTLHQKLKRSRRFTRDDAELLISVYREMERLRFTRLDTALFHILLPEREPGSWKLIDLVHAYRRKGTFPKTMLNGLRRLGMLEDFYEHLKDLEPGLYESWRLIGSEVD